MHYLVFATTKYPSDKVRSTSSLTAIPPSFSISITGIKALLPKGNQESHSGVMFCRISSNEKVSYLYKIAFDLSKTLLYNQQLSVAILVCPYYHLPGTPSIPSIPSRIVLPSSSTIMQPKGTSAR